MINMANAAEVTERRKRCLEQCRAKYDDKRLHIESLKHELNQLTMNTIIVHSNQIDSDSPSSQRVNYKSPSGSSNDSHNLDLNSSDIVVSLSTARKSARKMIKDPLAATAGRREATIIARVQEMQQLGIWNSKKIPKINMPARPKTHWDYVIEEMNWLSSVILQERKTKKVNIFFDNFLLFFFNK